MKTVNRGIFLFYSDAQILCILCRYCLAAYPDSYTNSYFEISLHSFAHLQGEWPDWGFRPELPACCSYSVGTFHVLLCSVSKKHLCEVNCFRACLVQQEDNHQFRLIAAILRYLLLLKTETEEKTEEAHRWVSVSHISTCYFSRPNLHIWFLRHYSC